MSSYIGKININGTQYPVAQTLFGTCNTAAGTSAKVVSCADFDTLVGGVVVNVNFTNANTASSITLNIGGTGAKQVYVDSSSNLKWDAGATKTFVYYDNKWRLINPTSVGTTYADATTSVAGLMSTADKTALNNLKNIKAFSTVYAGNNTSSFSAGSSADILFFVAGTNTTIEKQTQQSINQIKISSTNTTYNAATTAAAGLMSADDKKKLNSVASSATYNLAFKTIKVGTTDLVADTVDDTLTITAGNNITLTPTVSSDSFTIAATNTTYGVATTAANGLMSSADKIKLDGLQSYWHYNSTNETIELIFPS